MISRTIKTAALAAAVLVATAGASFASQYAWVDQDANVYFKHKTSSTIVNYVEEGQKVKILASWNNWYYIKVPGDDGWVKASKLDFHPHWDDADYDYPGYPVGGSLCVGGDHASFCLGTSY